MGNFAEISDIEEILQISISDPDKIASAEAALTAASAAIRIYTKQYIELVEDEEIVLDCRGGPRVYLPELPVVELSEIVEDEETLTDQEDYKLGQFGIIHRIGRKWSKGIQNLEITYSHGYATIPDAIIDICARAASRRFQAGLKASSEEGVPGVASKSLGDYSVSYANETGEGLLGVSGARLLLLSEKDELDYYRFPRP